MRPSSIFTLFVSLIILSSIKVDAQINRTNNKSSNTYRNSFQRISTGSNSNSTFEIRGDGSLWAWGKNDYGQLGDGTTINKISPTKIGIDNNWVSVALGFANTIALKGDGSLWAWGRNDYGQLGDGTNTDKIIPIQIGIDKNWVSIASGSSHTIAIKNDGTLWAWGNNSHGQLGDGTTISKNIPIQIGTDVKWVSISVGESHTVSIKSDGTLWTWGKNDYGQLGDGTIIDKIIPTQIGTENKWVTIAAANNNTASIKSDGTLWVWGSNYYGQLGDGTTSDKIIPAQVGTDKMWVSISGGGYFYLATKSDGTYWSWGDNRYGQLGDGTTNNQSLPTQVDYDNKWVVVSAGSLHSIALKSDGSIWCNGKNNAGQLGNNTVIDNYTPIQTSVYDSRILNTVLGANHTVSLKTDGTLSSWGLNTNGQLGDGTTLSRNKPTQIDADNKWISIAAGNNHSIALKTDGTLWAWGYNLSGQLGNGNNTKSVDPIQIGGDTKWVSIAAGGNHSLGLKSDGTLWAWGLNTNGQLGDGTFGNKNNPTQIGTDTKWVRISAGGSHTLAVKSDGTLWAWGLNTNGQLGNGTTLSKNNPTQIGTDTKWVSISAGGNHTLAVKSDGTLWAWGLNTNGQLGDGTTISKNIPTQIVTDQNWMNIFASSIFSLALKSDGTLWGWGRNNIGQLGDGTTSDKIIPTQITSQSNVVTLPQGSQSNHTAILSADRRNVCLTGSNNYGQLGNGTTTNSNIYNCITFSSFVWTGASNSAWNDPMNWNLLQVPNSNDNAIIPYLINAPIINSIQSINTLIINEFAILNIEDTLKIGGSIINNGEVFATNGTIEFNGTSAQTISPNTFSNKTIQNLIINNTSGVTNTDSLALTGSLTPTSGTLFTGGLLKLKSSSTNTARVAIGSSAGGYINGNILVERYIPGGYRKFRFLGHPFSSAMNVSELTDDIDITGAITGANASNFTASVTNNPSSFTFTEANGNNAIIDAGWSALTSNNSATSIAKGQGFRILVRGSKGQIGSLTGGVYTPSSVTIDMAGSLNQGDFTQNLSYSGATKGWNLISNPYTSNIDWDLVRMSSLTNVNDAVYSYRPSLSGGTYATYINGSATNGASNIIEAGSAFFVRANAAAASISWQEADKTAATPTNTMFRSNQNITNRILLQLKYDSTQYTDEVVLRFGDDKNATDNFDATLDAENLPGSSHDLFVKDNNSKTYSIYHGKELATWQTENRTIQLGITTYTKGNYTLGATVLNDFTNGNKAWLKDAFTNTLTEITTGMTYGFAVTTDVATQSNNRFSILFNPKEKVAPTIHSLTVKVSPNPAKGLLQLSYSQSDLLNTTITISNAEGKNVQSKSLGKVQYGIEKIDISQLSAGIYFVQFSNGVETKTEKIIVE